MKKILFLAVLFFSFSLVFAESIPRIDIIGDISEMKDKSDERSVQINYSSDNLTFSSYASIKLQGASSLQYPKKNYNVKFYKDSNNSTKNKIDFGWGSYYKYVLKANWIDRTHSRNIVNSRIVSDIYKKYGYFTNTPSNGCIDGFPVEVYVNGEFHGLYTLNLHKEYMFDDGKDYLLISTNGDFFFYDENIIESSDWKNFEVEVGEQNQDSLNKLNRLLTFINTSTDEEFKNDIEEYFNLDSLLNYYCFVRFADLSDSLSNNLYLLTYDGKVWYTVFYDMDVSYGVTWQGYPEYEYNISSYIKDINLWRKLESNFSDEISTRWTELRKNILTKNNVMSIFYEFYNNIPTSSLNSDVSKWSDMPYFEIANVGSFLDVRIVTMDKYMKKLNNKSDSSNNAGSSNNSSDFNSSTNSNNSNQSNNSNSSNQTNSSNNSSDSNIGNDKDEDVNNNSDNSNAETNSGDSNSSDKEKEDNYVTSNDKNDDEIKVNDGVIKQDDVVQVLEEKNNKKGYIGCLLISIIVISVVIIIFGTIKRKGKR